ncbi:MAG: hypothetical protein ACLTDX_09790 [[Clostridium] innocuum]
MENSVLAIRCMSGCNMAQEAGEISKRRREYLLKQCEQYGAGACAFAQPQARAPR